MERIEHPLKGDECAFPLGSPLDRSRGRNAEAIDVFLLKYPKKVQSTYLNFFRNAFERNRGWRIDHILAIPELAKFYPKVVVDIDPRSLEGPSDHTFVKAKFRIS